MKTRAKFNGLTGYIDGYFAGNGVACAAFVADGVIHVAPLGKIEVLPCEKILKDSSSPAESSSKSQSGTLKRPKK
jgi:hypothetical protein